ncbi:MAG: transcriptional repressor NrdR [Anaerolineae bacterium]|nr:transcriptional repressor NrdR [Anaerolineae bacterium]
MLCPYCGHPDTRVVDTSADPAGGEIRRRRECRLCSRRFTTAEHVQSHLPLIVKGGGDGLPPYREPFDPDKVRHGIELACAKRPIPPSTIDRLVRGIQAQLQELHTDEVPSRLIGEMVIAGLREVDEIAYIRYAIVFLGLDDLIAVRDEIDRLMRERKIRPQLSFNS